MRRSTVHQRRPQLDRGRRLPAVRRATPLAPHVPAVITQRRKGPPLWALVLMRRRPARRLGTLILALFGIALIVGVSGARYARQNVGYVGVVRNGGPLDTLTFRQILEPGQRLTWIGFFSQAPHQYPSASVSRAYTVTSDARKTNRPGVATVTVPTRDGVQVSLEATVFIRFVGESNPTVLRRFDDAYATRRFPTPSGHELYPWQGNDGFYALLDAVFRPVLAYDIRKELGQFQCAALVASCALVSQGANATKVPLANADAIADRIGASVDKDLERTLGQPYFSNIRVRIARVTLPASVQTAIDDAQAKYAAVSGARAELAQARYIAEKNRLLGDSYNKSPALATVEALKAIPKGSTVIVSAGGKAPSVFAGAGAGAAGVVNSTPAPPGG
jgi:regulator of protease activity HflC (stomatin/prohibitin superfamily)